MARIAWIISLVFLWIASECSAVSLGPMLVKSDFGERFNAEIELDAPGVKNLDVSIGSTEDYKMLNLDRPSVVGQLEIKRPFHFQGDKLILNVVSERALFYPAFSLVIKVKQPEGIIYENYMITVDFEQSVSLKLKASRESDSEEPAKEEPIAALASKGGGDPAGPEDSLSEEAVPSDNPEPLEETPVTELGEGVPPTPVVISKVPTPDHVVALPRSMPLVDMAPPVPLVSAAPAPAQEETQVASQPVQEPVQEARVVPAPEPEIPVEPEEPPAPELDLPGVVEERSPAPSKVSTASLKTVYGPVKRGDTLTSVVRSLQFQPSEQIRVTAALWMDNQDQFINNNIHGLRQGAVLNLENLQKRMAQISAYEARWILRNHWQEWKLIHDREELEKQPAMNTTLAEWMLPKEDNSIRAGIMDRIRQWETTWEQGALDPHIALFSRRTLSPMERTRDGDFAYWYRFKKTMFARHRNVEIEIFQPRVVVLETRAFVGFDQKFDSDTMKSFGRKEIEFVKEPDGWKITKETFTVKQFWDKEKMPQPDSKGENVAMFQPDPIQQYPYVVHASTQVDWNSALQLVNGLRELGFNAYAAPLYVNATRKIYRVFVDRMAQWEAAEELAQILRKTDFAPFAIPIEFPYTLEVGEYLDEDRARDKMTQLHNQGLSPFLFSPESVDQAERTVKVMLGAFFKKDNAQRMSFELEEKRVEWSLISP